MMSEVSRLEIVGRYAQVDGHRLYYEEAGEGRPVVCVHTSGQSGLQWRFLLPYLAERGYRCLAVDLPAHGKSLARGFKPLSTVRAHSEVLWILCQQLGLERPAIVGCSIGANIALDLGVTRPGGVRALIACDGAAHNPTVPPAGVRLLMEDSSYPAAGDQAFYGSVGACGSKALTERTLEIGWTARSRDPKVQGCDLAAWNGHDIRAELGRVRCPVLLVRGEEDFLVPSALMRATRDGLADAEYVELPGIGHFPHMESPEFPALVHDFLRRRGF